MSKRTDTIEFAKKHVLTMTEDDPFVRLSHELLVSVDIIERQHKHLVEMQDEIEMYKAMKEGVEIRIADLELRLREAAFRLSVHGETL